MKRSFVMPALIAALFTGPAVAADLVYTPLNPSFGGSSFNSAHLLGIAEIHRPDPPQEAGRDIFGNDLTDTQRFTQALESRILSELSFDIVDRIFNGTTQTGRFEFDTTRLDFTRNLDDSVSLVITDTVSGAVTNILVPSFLAQNP